MTKIYVLGMGFIGLPTALLLAKSIYLLAKLTEKDVDDVINAVINLTKNKNVGE
ncbi:MAG TPA: hypothetical protein VF354_05300 [Candidatus Methanoperedens sp.]